MSVPKFVWIIRSWCSLDSFWEHVREHKEYDVAYVSPELLLEEIDRIILKEQADWEDICLASGSKVDTREFGVEKPTLDTIKSRPFVKFLTISSTNQADAFMQSWYVERMKVADRD
jgi:hypothetical protein